MSVVKDFDLSEASGGGIFGFLEVLVEVEGDVERYPQAGWHRLWWIHASCR